MFMSFQARALGLDLDAAASLELAARHGFHAVDLLVRDLRAQGADPAAIRDQMAAFGLRGGAWPLPVRWRGPHELYLSDLAELNTLAALAQKLGLLRTGTWVFPAIPRHPDVPQSPQAIHDWQLARLLPIARILDDHGVRLGLEVIGLAAAREGQGTPLTHRVADLDTLLAALRAEVPSVGILLDAFHLFAAGEPVSHALRFGARAIAWVHVADPQAGASRRRDLLRDTQRDWPEPDGPAAVAALLSLLDASGYDGPVTVETHIGGQLRRDEPENTASRAAQALRVCWPGSS